MTICLDCPGWACVTTVHGALCLSCAYRRQLARMQMLRGTPVIVATIAPPAPTVPVATHFQKGIPRRPDDAMPGGKTWPELIAERL